MAKKMEAGQTQTLKKVLHYMKPYRFFLLLSVILAAITVASTLYLPLLIGKAVDCIVGKGNVNFDGLIAVLIKMAVMIGITALAQWIMNVCNNKLTYQIVRDIRNEAFEKIEVLPLKYIDGHAHGEIVSRVIADVILVMKDGHIIEQGNHETLLAQNGFYATLYNSQYAM